MTTPRRFDGYIRVSQTNGREGESFRSPSQQRELIERWAADKGAEIVAWHEDLDVSGSRMDRPALNDALARIRTRTTGGLAVAFLDRFSRAKVGEAMAVWDEVTASGGTLIAADLPSLDPSDKMGEYALTNLLATKRMEWRTAAERWDMSRSDAIRAGKAIGGAPFGYRFADPASRARGEGIVDSRLVLSEYAPLVGELFERRASGASWLELARWMDTIAPKSKKGRWHRNTIKSMIASRTYLGEVRHGKHVNAAAHEPIVTEALWNRAQSAPAARTPRGAYLLSGLVRCAACGRSLRGTTLGRDGRRVHKCSERACPERVSVMAGALDDEVTEQLFAHLDAYHLQRADADAAFADADQRADEAEERVRMLAAVVPKSRAGLQAHQAALDDAERDLMAAEDLRQQLSASVALAGPGARELRADWPRLTIAERREVLRAAIVAVLVRRASSRTPPRPPFRDRVRVVFVGEAPDGLADYRGPIRSWSWDDDEGSLAAAA